MDYMKLVITPIKQKEAKLFVERNHRHHPPPQGSLFSIAVSPCDDGVGVAMVGRPVARVLADGWTTEVTRVAVKDGFPNACSMLYAACWRSSRSMGYKKCVTYTLDTEAGVSIKAAGWKIVGKVKGRSWSTKSRPRVDKHPLQGKLRWEISA